MAQVDFYQLSRDPVERVVPLLAAKAVEGGGRLLVVSGDAAQRGQLSQALWNREGAFLANAEASDHHANRQPILLSDICHATNGAAMALIVDGTWHDEAAAFARTILLFGNDRTNEARHLWSTLGASGHALRIFKQRENGGWREGR